MNRKDLILRFIQLTENSNSYTSKILDKLGDRVVQELVNKMINDENFDLREFLKNQQKMKMVEDTEKTLYDLAEKRMSGEVNGEVVDGFSAFMVAKVLEKLDPKQKVHLLSKPTNEIVAISYKLASRAEF